MVRTTVLMASRTCIAPHPQGFAHIRTYSPPAVVFHNPNESFRCGGSRHQRPSGYETSASYPERLFTGYGLLLDLFQRPVRRVRRWSRPRPMTAIATYAHQVPTPSHSAWRLTTSTN